MVHRTPLKRMSIFQWFTLVYYLGIVLGSAAASAQDNRQTQWSKPVHSLTIFQPGDAVRIQVWELYQEERRNLDLSGDYPINPEGFIIMPIIGEVRVKGLTVFEVMQTLEERLKAYLKNVYIYVRPLIRLTLGGAFNRPGSYRADPQSSLWNLVAQAEGPARDCDLRRLRVERGGKVVLDNLLASFEKGYSLEEVGIESGDQIVAPFRRGLDIRLLMIVVNLFASMVLLYLRLKTGQW